MDQMVPFTFNNSLKLGLPLFVGLAVLLLFFGLFLGWSLLIPLDSAAIAMGELGVDSKRKTIQHLEGGIIRSLHVRDGDQVEAGQLLIRLDETQSRANKDQLAKRYATTQAHEARLNAERDGLDKIVFPAELLVLRDNSEVATMMESQERIMLARAKALNGKRAILRQRIEQYLAEIRGLKGEISAQDERIRLGSEEVSAYQKLLHKGMVSKPRMLELQREIAEVKGFRSQNVASVARVHQRISETELEIAELDVLQVNEVVQELRDVQSEQYDLREKIRAAEDVYTRTEIRSPIAGTIVSMAVHTVGGVIAPGNPVMDIVPLDERLVIEARIHPSDIDIVEVGLSAHVRFTAFSQRHISAVEGRVLSVSADRLMDDRSGEPFYIARIELQEDVHQVIKGERLYPGMQAEVMVVTGARTPMDYFFQPITESFNRSFREQ